MLKSKKSLKNQKIYDSSPKYEKWEMKLSSNESPFAPSANVLQAIRNIPEGKIAFYPAYYELQELIAQRYSLFPENILCTNGADEAINLVISTFIDKNDEIVTAVPSFSMPKLYANIQSGKYKEVLYDENFQYPYEKIKKTISRKTKMIIFTTPNNPTGEIIDKDFIEQIAQKYSNTVILIDATYASFAEISYFDLVKQYDNVIVIKSFSKDYALAGLRLGFVASQNQNILEITKVKSPYNVNAIAVQAGIAAILDKEYLNTINYQIQESKKYLKENIENLGFKVYDSDANFLLIDFKEKCEFIYNKLKRHSIIVRIFRNDDVLKNHLRITIPPLDNARKIIEILSNNQTLVFDMDGVLIDVRKSFREATKCTYKYFTDKDVSEDEIKSLKNQGGYNNDWDLTHYLIAQAGIKVSQQQVIQKFEELYWNNSQGFINNELPIFNKEQLENLSKNYNLVVFTGRPKEEALYTLNLHGITNLFDLIVTMDDVGLDHQKPDAKGFDIIREKIICEDVMYFGDTVDDMVCATNAGVPAVGVLPPQDKSEELKITLKNSGAMLVLNNICEIEACLEKTDEKQCC